MIKFIQISYRLSLFIISCSILGCTPPATPVIYNDPVIADESRTAEWLAYGGTHYERRFSPIKDINLENVNDLQVDWFMDLPNDVGLVSTPLVIDGVLYFTGTMNVLRAVNAVTGELIWQFDPKVGEAIKGKKQVGWVHNRGLSFYEGKIFTATWDGRLIALDARSGKEIWAVTTFDPERALYITGAPKAFKGKVIIGNGGTENGPSRGFVTAYDANTGEELWKFHIVPGNPADGFESSAMEMAADTWTGEWWKHGGGGNAWHAFTYDPELDQLYIGTGNGSPWNRKIRSPEGGDNLFLCSIVALDPDSGEYLWHYQTTPGESWDYNSNMDIVLADLTVDDKPIKAIMHAPKNGFFYVIDRANGKLVSAEPFVETSWASHIDMTTGRPVEIEGARYEQDKALITPSPWGGHTWHAMSYNPETELVYIPALHLAAGYSDEGIDLETWRSIEFMGGMGVDIGLDVEGQPRSYPASLIAWDPVNQEAAWTVAQDDFWNAGTMTTAGGLVFQGRADGHFLAYNAATGDILWDFNTGLGISAPPITYKINGRQYVALLVGWGGGYAGIAGEAASDLGWAYGKHNRRLITFSLGGTMELPPLPEPHLVKPLQVPDLFEVNDQLAAGGAMVYGLCQSCHGWGMYAGGMAPDLRESQVPLEQKAFTAVVRDGLLSPKGMPSFPDISDGQLEALMHHIRKRAHSSTATLE